MITITHELEALRRQLDPDHLAKAEKSALKAVQRKAATRISKSVRGRFNVTARAIAERLNLRLGKNDTEAYLLYVGARIGLINFSAQFRKVRTGKGPRQGATAKITKDAGRYIAPGGFIAKGANNNVQVFQRMSKKQSGRLPLRKMTGPAIAQMVDSQEVMDDATNYVEEEYPKELTNRLNYFLDKQMKR